MKYSVLLVFVLFLSSCEDRILDQRDITFNLPGSWLDDMALDAYGSLWLSTGEIDTTAQIPSNSNYLPKRHYLIRTFPGDYKVFDEDFIGGRILFDKNNRLWIMTPKNIYYYRKFNEYVNVYSLEDTSGIFQCMINDKDNNIWVGGLSPYLVRISPDLFVTQYDTVNSPIPESIVIAAHVDQNDNRWFSFGKQIGRLDKAGNWKIYDPAEAPVAGRTVRSIGSDNFGNVWFGTDFTSEQGNLLRFDGSNWTKHYAKDENGRTISGSVRQIYRGRNKIWMVADEFKPFETGKVYVLTYDGNLWKRVPEVPEDDNVVDIEFDYLNNKAWVGTANNGCLHIK